MINFLTRRKHQVWGTGKSDVQQMLEAKSGAEATITQMFEVEIRREAFRWAAKAVQEDVKETTWQAFWLSTIDDLPATEVARQLGMSVGSVYIARSRVMARLRRAASEQ
jgi:RNA polymerase sigma-70 factor (ECF subfamily)